MIEQLHPQLIVLDIDAIDPADSPLIRIASIKPAIPVIATTAQHNYESPAIAHLLQQGVFDCLLKPYAAEILINKITQAFAMTQPEISSSQLHDFSSFFERIKQLNAAQNIETLLDVSFEYFMLVAHADMGAFYLFNRDKHTWRKVREKKEAALFPDDIWIHDTLRKIMLSGQSYYDDGKKSPGLKKPSKQQQAESSVIVAPLNAGSEICGCIILHRSPPASPFQDADIKATEIIATQVGSVFINMHLYETVNQRLHELHIISAYSEKLMRLVDTVDVLKSLGETTVKHLHADFAAFLIVQRRAHEFLYWSRYSVPEKLLQEFCHEALAAFNRAHNLPLRTRRIAFTPMTFPNETINQLPLPQLAFRHVVPLCWEDIRFGAVILGSIIEPVDITDKLALLSSLINQTHIALANTKLYTDMKENYIRTIKALAIAVDAKDTYTHGHSENVMNIAEAIARELSIDERTVGSIRDAGLLHDIGKIGIPGYILNKPGPLTYEEFNGIMKTHSTLGANIVRDVPFLRDLYRLILYHHEHYDGNGYPDGLKGEQIPLGARILHVADAFEAMTSDRPYRSSLGREEAIKRLCDASGRQFDPAIIAAFLQVAKRENWHSESTSDSSFPFSR